MKTNTIRTAGKLLLALTALTMTAGAFAQQPKDTMCVKQKDGTYKCKASGKIMKEACCDTPSNDVKTPKLKK